MSVEFQIESELIGREEDPIETFYPIVVAETRIYRYVHQGKKEVVQKWVDSFNRRVEDGWHPEQSENWYVGGYVFGSPNWELEDQEYALEERNH